jgi:HSP20 family molecular chaperone IbpA
MTVLGEAVRALPDGTFVDVHESPDAYLVVIDAPGVTADDLSVEATAGVLEVTAPRPSSAPAEYEPVRTGRSDRLEVALPLPPDARTEGVESSLDRGVVTVTVPKTERPGPARRGGEDGSTD